MKDGLGYSNIVKTI